MNRRSHPRGTTCALAVLGLVLGTSCMPLHPKRKRRPLSPPRATFADVTAPRRAIDEARRLPQTPGGQLRRAWLLTRHGDAHQAVRVTNRMLYDRARHAASVRSIAYYVRAQAFAKIGQKDRTKEDLIKARSISVDRRLRDRCQRELLVLAPPRQKPKAQRPVVAKAGKPNILPRSAWNASRPRAGRLDPMRGIRKLTIHHSANISRNIKRKIVATQIRGIQQYHVSQNRWGDIGYHYLIDPAGRIWQGRSIRYQGAHAGGANNRNNVGICLLGKFTGGGQNPTREQIAAMTDLVVWLRDTYRIPRLGVLTHKEIKSETVCPGSRLQNVVDRMRRLFAARGATEKTESVAGR